jgi:hypothetical protein
MKSVLSRLPIRATLRRVKWISIIWLALWSCAAGMSKEVGDAALRFMEKARDGELDLEPGRDTALAPQTSSRKREEIAGRLERLAGDIGDNTLELAGTRVDGDLAAAVVRATSGFDPTSIRVFAIALVKRDDRWLPAPVPASFENTGHGYAPATRRSVADLQNWMLREQALDIERLKEEMAGRMRSEISRSLPAAELQAMDAAAAARRFLDACANRKLPEMLALLGGLSRELPEDWAQRLSSAQAAAAGEPASRPWHLLVSDHVLRAVIGREEMDGTTTVSVGFLDPGLRGSGIPSPRIELLELPFTKSSDGTWRCDPPPEFQQPSAAGEAIPSDSPGDEVMDEFVKQIAVSHPPQPRDNARAALDALLAALGDRDPGAVARLLPPAGDDPADARDALSRAAHIWWSLAKPADPLHAIQPALGVDGEIAAAVCQFFSPRNPDRPALRVMYFRKSAEGWFWQPIPDEDLETGMRQWVRDQSADREAKWRERLLADCVRLERLPESAVPDEAEAERVVREWLDATRAGDVETALRLTARLAAEDSAEAVLRNLGYEIAGNRMSEPAPRVIHRQRSGIWTAVGAQTVTGDESSFPLYPVVRTAEGPRILIEIDLFAATKRSRDFLNKTALSRLDDQPPQAAADLRGLLREHEKRVAEKTD